MLKAILYLSLTAFGILGTFVNPIIGAVACLEAYLMNPTVIPMPDGGFRYQFWTTIAFVLSCFIPRPRKLDRVGGETYALVAMWVFVAIAAASSLWAAVSPEIALDTSYEIFKTLLFATFLLKAVQTERHVRIVVLACMFGILHASVLHTLGTKYGYIPPSFGREIGVLPDLQTGVLIFFLPLMLLIAANGSKLEKIFCWLSLPVVLDSIVTSYMRAALVAMSAELALIFLLLKPKLTRRLIPAVAAGLILFFVRLTPESYWNWMSTIEHPKEEASANSRFVIDAISWRIFSDHPMGVGYRNYPEISPQYFPPDMLDPSNGKRSAHNSFFTVLVETGVLGFAAFMTAVGGTVILLRRIRKSCDPTNPGRVAIYAMGLEIGMYGWFVLGLFHTEHDLDPAYWTVALAVILTRLHYQNRKAEESGGEDERDEMEPAFEHSEWAETPSAGTA